MKNQKNNKVQPLSTLEPAEVIKRRFPQSDLYLILIVFSLIISGSVCFYHYRSFRGSGVPPSDGINTICKRAHCQPQITPEYCLLPQSMQFDKFVWFVTDGFGYYRIHDTLLGYSPHLVPYNTIVEGNKWSHTIYTSWFTGLPPTNILGETIEGDNLFASLARVKTCDTMNPKRVYNIRYVGPEWSPLSLIGGKEVAEEKYGIEADLVEEHLGQSAYPTLTPEVLKGLLSQGANRNESFIFHTGTFDKAAHYASRTQVDEIGSDLNTLFDDSTLRDFIAEHPDYLLIISADHGVTYPDIFHGESHAGTTKNVGYITFYNPNLSPAPLSEIDVVDVLPTIAKYLKGVDIPYHSVGMAQNSFGADKTPYLHSMQQNLYQLSNAARYRGISFDENMIAQLLADKRTYAIPELLSYVMMLKARLYNNDMPLYIFTIAAFFIASLFLLTYWFVAINRKALSTVFVTLPLLPVIFFTSNHLRKRYILTGRFFFGWNFLLFITAFAFAPSRASLLWLNEGINVLNWAIIRGMSYFPQWISLMPFLGVSLSLWESISYKRHISPVIWRWSVFLHVTCLLFFLTRGVDSLYFFYGFHPLAFIGYAGSGILFLYSLVARKFSMLPLPPTIVLLMLRGGDLSIVFFNLRCHYLFPRLLERHSSVASWQAMGMYLMYQVFSVFSLPMGEVLLWDVDPVSGSVGLTDWNLYPIFSGFLMAFAKYGIFLLSIFQMMILFPHPFPILAGLTQTTILSLVLHWVIAVFVSSNHSLDSVFTLLFFFIFQTLFFTYSYVCHKGNKMKE